MSIISAERAIDLICQSSWSGDDVLRVFWLQVDGPRESMAKSLRKSLGKEEVLAVVVRDDSFKVANRVLADISVLLESCKDSLIKAGGARPEKVTIVALVKESFGRAQIGSPITLPNWFPVRPGLHTHLYLTDLVGLAEGTLLNGPEAQIDRIAELVLNLESSLVAALKDLYASEPLKANAFLGILLAKETVDVPQRLVKYENHLDGVALPRGYRPNAAESTNSIISDILRLFLSRSVDDLAKATKGINSAFPKAQRLLKPSYLGVSLRPRGSFPVGARNWFSLFVGVYQSYQVMNAAAHAGDYGLYPPALLHYSSCDLQLFLEDADALFAYAG